MNKKPLRSMNVTQNSDPGEKSGYSYNVISVVNSTEPKIHTILSEAEVKSFIDRGYKVNINS